MAALLEQVLKDKKDIFALENGHLSPAEYHRRWEQETQNLATLLRAPPTRHANGRSSNHEPQHADSADCDDVVSYNPVVQAQQQQQARLPQAQPPVDRSVEMAPTMSRKRSSHSQFGPVPFSGTEEQVPPLLLDWQTDNNSPFNGLNARSFATPASKKRRQSLQVSESPQSIKVYEPSAYCENQPALSPTFPSDVQHHRASSQHYITTSPYPPSSATSHSPATSMSDLFAPQTPSTSTCMSREPSLYENMSMMRFKSQSSDDMHDSQTFNTQSTSNGSQSNDLSPFNPSLSFLHASGVADDASCSPVSNLATCYTSPSTVIHDNNMTRSLSSESTESSKSRSSRRSLQEVVQGQGARHIKPKENSTSMSRQPSSSSCVGVDMARTRSEDGLKVVIPKNQTYVRPQHPKVFCEQCNIKPEGFRGPHELRRHMENKHSPTRTVWVCKDRSADQKFLSKCKACNEGKMYGAYYNAAAHLRRIHFHAKVKGKKGKGSSKEKPRGGDGGGDDPPMEIIKLWIEASQVSKDDPPIKDDETDESGSAPYLMEDTPDEYYGNGYCQPNSLPSIDATTLLQPSFTSQDSSHAINDVPFSPSYDTNTSFDMNTYVQSAPSMFTSSTPATEFDVDTNASVITPVNQDLPSNNIMNVGLYNSDFPGSMDQFDLNDPSIYPFV
ncbi:hypothetical protein JMJ35_006383 [Cladonia borealis]|uniref:DUF7896 domain-containing protein n=1 Tax=Cladonia borealis TaxID=184061 RepID=A0AA39QZT8_9LECA|nr:hypothetical protein JMJ35_006383 [Cladonia borealis]